jgi:hypothetical protein
MCINGAGSGNASAEMGASEFLRHEVPHACRDD